MSKLLYTIGNLYTGQPYGVEAEREFGTKDVFGPFNSENAANNFAHKLAQDPASLNVVNDVPRYVNVTVVQIELPKAGVRITRTADGHEYAA